MSPDTTANFEIFGDYVLLKQLASGGMAEVFLARPVSSDANGRIVVIKRILRQVAGDELFIKMFRSEIRVTLGFNHPHTIQVHDFGEIDGQPYIAMEYIEGKSLRQIADRFLEQNEAIPVPTVLGLIAQAASGLGYAHHFENSVTGEVVNAVHRDISPQNLIVSYDGNLKVIDFGIAKAKNEIADKTRAGQIKGKCGYLSPEQLEEKPLDGRSDVFSLGIVAWELLTAHRLFHRHGDTEMAIMQRIQNCDQFMVPPSRLNPDLPPEVDRVIMQALHRDRDLRYPTAAAFQAALRKTLQQFYPNHTYGDTAQLMKVLFEKDIVEERMILRELNTRAQHILVAQREAETKMVQMIEKHTDTGLFGGMFKSLRPQTGTQLPNLMELKIANIEAVLKQRATGRHVFIGALWVISLIGIKLDERYSLLDRYFLPATAEADIAANDYRLEQYRQQLREKYGASRHPQSQKSVKHETEVAGAVHPASEVRDLMAMEDQSAELAELNGEGVDEARPSARGRSRRSVEATPEITASVREPASVRKRTRSTSPVKVQVGAQSGKQSRRTVTRSISSTSPSKSTSRSTARAKRRSSSSRSN